MCVNTPVSSLLDLFNVLVGQHSPLFLRHNVGQGDSSLECADLVTHRCMYIECTHLSKRSSELPVLRVPLRYQEVFLSL